MKIDHIAIWVKDLEKIKNFYVHYFGMSCNEKYVNPNKQFSSYFLSCKGAETRIELMHRPDISSSPDKHTASIGLTHFAIAVDSKETVNSLTEKLRADGYKIVGEPRTTGDGYYESVVEDGEGNQVEITVHEPIISPSGNSKSLL
jgi:lactoylglutathione lyase